MTPPSDFLRSSGEYTMPQISIQDIWYHTFPRAWDARQWASGQTSGRCEWTSAWMSECPIANVSISRGSESLWYIRDLSHTLPSDLIIAFHIRDHCNSLGRRDKKEGYPPPPFAMHISSTLKEARSIGSGCLENWMNIHWSFSLRLLMCAFSTFQIITLKSVNVKIKTRKIFNEKEF